MGSTSTTSIKGDSPDPVGRLDPDNWDDFETFLQRMARDVPQHLKTISQRPVWRKPNDAAEASFTAPPPSTGQGLAATYEEFQSLILPHLTGNLHPRFWGWVIGSGAPSSMVGDWLAAFTNGVPTLFDEASLRTELQVIEWIKQLLGISAEASGVLTTGVSEATLIALTVARYAAFGETLKQEGVFADGARARFYISDQTHDCARKAISILGFGSRHMRIIPTNSRFQMDVAQLEQAIAEDIDAGLVPVAAIATAGTVNTGAFDDIVAIREICRAREVWLHVDGAFGAWTAITSEHSHLASGLDLADSLVFDMHKWMYQTYGIGCVMIRDQELHTRALQIDADYLAHLDGTLSDAPADLCSRSVQLSRDFRALKFWFSLKSDGVGAYADAISGNIALAQYLTRQIEQSKDLELLAPTSLHIVNFRYRGNLRCRDEIDRCNRSILQRLHREGVAIPSSTMIEGKFSIRVCFSNHRTVRRDIDESLEQLLAFGRSFASKNPAARPTE